jgi:hypothetical protein
VFFKPQLVMFFEGIRSERKLVEVASLNLAHRWYLGFHLDEPLPDHSSLTRIRDRYGLVVFRRFFEHVVELYQEAGLVWGKELLFDATQVQANAALDSLVPRLHEVARRHTDGQFGQDGAGSAPATGSAHEEEVAPERDAAAPSPLQPAVAGALAVSAPLQPPLWDLLEECRLDPARPPVNGYQRKGDQRVSTTDPGAAPMSSGGRLALGYHDHYVVDGGRARPRWSATVVYGTPIAAPTWRTLSPSPKYSRRSSRILRMAVRGRVTGSLSSDVRSERGCRALDLTPQPRRPPPAS